MWEMVDLVDINWDGSGICEESIPAGQWFEQCTRAQQQQIVASQIAPRSEKLGT
jgi:hypothetical protein